MAKKKSESSPLERRLPASALFTSPLSDRQRRELERLARMLDSEIDYSDAAAMKSVPSARPGRPILQADKAADQSSS